ncbi:MAG: sulfotransferase domain-containing protein [Phycisphaerales bacterium]|nr:sulfotransferase domain-containing protein [Phycisphaerales bacterium]
MNPAGGIVTIVSGLPRSGTSMMMRMIDAGGIPALTDNVRTADQDNPRGYYEYEPVKRTKEDPSWVDAARGRVVKMVYRLLYDLPARYTYRVVFMRRNLMEVVASQDVMLTRRGREGGELPPDKLVALFTQQLDEFDRWVRAQPNFGLLYVDYNEVVRDPGPAVARLNEFLGGALDTAAMRAVVEPELYRQRRG